MKILFICWDGYKIANARVRCYRFAKELNKNNIEAEVLSYKDHLNAPYEGWESHKTKNSTRLWLNIKAFFRLIKEKKDTVFYLQKVGSYSWAPYIVHIIKGNTIIVDYDDYEYWHTIKGFSLTKIFCKFTFKTIVKSAKFCIAASHNLIKVLEKYNKEIEYIPTGVDLNVFKPENKKQIKNNINNISNNNKTKEIIVAWIGVIVDDQAIDNVKFVIDCVHEINNDELGKNTKIRLEIAGAGNNLDRITKYITELNDHRIKYLGFFKPDEIPKYLNKVDIGLVSLIEPTEYNKSKSPTKLFEYMAMKIPVVSTDIGENSYVIKQGKNSFLAKNKKEYIKKIILLAKDSKLRKKLGENARKDVEEEYSVQILAKRLSEIYRKRIGNNSRLGKKDD